MLIIVFITIYMILIIMLNFICIYNYTKAQTLYLYIIIMNRNNIRVSISFSSMYKANDVSNIHIKSFYLHYIQSFQMSRGTVERPSSYTLRFG